MASCDVSTPLEINESKTYDFTTNCGDILVNGWTFSEAVSLNQSFEGEFDINLDSLEIRLLPKELKVDTIKWLHFKNEKLQPINTRYLNVKDEKIILRVELSQSILIKEGLLEILPCSYIKCKGVPLIQDTIRIKL